MRRRRLLHLLGGSVLPFSGCLGSEQEEASETATPPVTSAHSRSPTATKSPTDTPTTTEPSRYGLSIGETATFPNGMRLTVTEPTVQQSIIADSGPFFSVVQGDGQQIVVVDVEGTREVEVTDFAVRRDEQIKTPPKQRRYVEPVTRTCSGTCIGLPIVTRATDSAAVVYKPDDRVSATWTLSADTVALFSTQPQCELRDAQLTERTGETAMRFTVENVGPRDVGFRALISPAWLPDVSEPVGFPVPEGETVTETVVPPALDGLAPEKATLTQEISEGTRYFEVETE